MWAVVGLGNPGRKYARTRHNIGWMVLDVFPTSSSSAFRESKNYSYLETSASNTNFLLLKPLTFMNLSGHAVRQALKDFRIPTQNLIVIHDDLDMDSGKLRIKKTGASGGHNGVQSIIQELGTRDFIRIKIGIGRNRDMDSADYVLGNFNSGELAVVKEVFDSAVEAVVTIATRGIEEAMNEFNKK